MIINYPQTIIRKTSGSNESESYLNKLCNETFLSLWSYSNVYRDPEMVNKSEARKKGDGKELCDLLVVFENHIIIFSDKSCSFPEADSISLSWSRWYKRAILRSANQIYGAERWLLTYPNLVYLDKQCSTTFPIKIPPAKEAIIHRIIVAHGASKACKRQYGGSGSLMIDSTIRGDVLPFTIGQIDENHGFIHVFDDFTLDLILKTLDTAPDFIDYLISKENYFLKKDYIMATGEEELLANYLSNINSNGNHCFLEADNQTISGVFYPEGIWENFCRKPERIRQLEENKTSYFWDELIEKFLYHIMTGTSHSMFPPDIKEQETIFRLMSKENRTKRRSLSNAFLDLIKKISKDQRATRIIYSNPDETCYLFLLFPYKETFGTYDKYRLVRQWLIGQYLYTVKNHFPNAINIIGIATECLDTGLTNHSEDIAYLDASVWTESDIQDSIDIENELIKSGLLAERSFKEFFTYEYPIDVNNISHYKGRDRNKSCYCGSGKKYKKCCGKFV